MKVVQPSRENIELLAQGLRSGGIAAMPTETVYGLAGSVFDVDALGKVFSAKDRPKFDPLIVHVALKEKSGDARARELDRLGLVQLNQFNSLAMRRLSRILESFWPGPLTVVLPKNPLVPDLATAGLPTVAIRMPNHEVALSLIDAVGAPLAAPSANRFGKISPTRPEHVVAELDGRVDHVLDGGPCAIGLESTVVGISLQGELTLLRPGGVSREELERCAETKVKAASPGGPLVAPGQTESHYAPSNPLMLLPRPLKEMTSASLISFLAQSAKALPQLRSLGILALNEPPKSLLDETLLAFAGTKLFVQCLSPGGNLTQAAQNLFHGLRALDEKGCELLVAELPENETAGLGHAIADRLRRASSPQRH